MKKLLVPLTFVLVFIAQSGFGQLQAKVDERFELTSIMFALAGAQEYSQCAIPSYRQDIAALAAEHNLAEPIEFIRDLREHHPIGYNAVSTTADMLEIVDGRVRLQAQYDISKIAEADQRWNEALFAEYLEMVNLFYKRSDFHTFFTDHGELYRTAEERMNALLAHIHTEWFESFFGKPFDPALRVYVSLTNGPSNYAVPDGILIGSGSDAEGLPFFGQGMLSIVLHEFGHHFTNPIVEAHWPRLEAAAEKIYPHVAEQMYANAYAGARTTMGEWMNNLFVLMYYREYAPDWISVFTADFMSRGFLWMERGVAFMDNFYMDRDRYPTIDAFMPRLAEHLNESADNIEAIIGEYDASLPYVVEVTPERGSEISGPTQIVITFSEPMAVGNNGFSYPTGDDVAPMEFVTGVIWSDDGLQITLLLDPSQAEAEGVYGLSFLHWAFRSQRGFQLKNNNEDLIYKVIKE